MTDQINIMLRLLQLQLPDCTVAYMPTTKEFVVANDDDTFSPIIISDNGLGIQPIELNLGKKVMYAKDLPPVNQAQISIKSGLHQTKINTKSGVNQVQISTKSGANQVQNSTKSEIELAKNITFLQVNQILKSIKSKGFLTQITKISQPKFSEIKLKDNLLPIELPTDIDDDMQIILHQLSRYVLSLCYAGIGTTKNENTIATIKEIYHKSIKDVANCQVRNLENNITALAKIVNRNNGANSGRKIGEENEKRRMQRKAQRIKVFVFSISILFFGILISAMIRSAFTGSPLPETAFTKKAKILNLDSTTIYSTLIAYQQQKDTVISEWRQLKVYEVLNGKKMYPEEFVVQLDSLIKYGWK